MDLQDFQKISRFDLRFLSKVCEISAGDKPLGKSTDGVELDHDVSA